MSAIRPTSLDAPLGDDGCTEVSEIVSDEMAFNPFDQLNEKDMYAELVDLLGQLNERERTIINSRFGLDGSEPITLEEVGEKMGVTRERIRQLQNAALSKMSRAFQGESEISFCPSMFTVA